MKIPERGRNVVVALGLSGLLAGPALAALTADQAVKIALENNPQVLQAEAGVISAKGGVYSAYSGVLPTVSASLARSNSVAKDAKQVFGPDLFVQDAEEIHGTTPVLRGSWSLIDLSAITGLRSAKTGLKAAKFNRQSTRNDIALSVREQFYGTVETYHLSFVANAALGVARDNERRARALFEVGSVSRSDLLQAQVRTAQSELDSLSAVANIIGARLLLAARMGITEPQLGEVDTVFAVTPATIDEPALLAEATKNRPDLLSAHAELDAAKSNRTSAHLLWLPTLDASSSYFFKTESRRTATFGDLIQASEFGTDRQWTGTLALNWTVFNGLAREGAQSQAEARLQNAQAEVQRVDRNLSAEVHDVVIRYQEAVERDRVAQRALESARENLKLTQQKYNVGSATILELVDAQVQATRAAVNLVSARAAIRISEAQIERVRGRGE